MIEKKDLLGKQAYPLKASRSNKGLIIFEKGFRISCMKIPVKDEEKRFDTTALQKQIPSMLLGGKPHIILFDEIISIKRFEMIAPRLSLIDIMKDYNCHYLEFLIQSRDSNEKFLVVYDDTDVDRFNEIEKIFKDQMGGNIWAGKLDTVFSSYPENTKEWQEYFDLIRPFFHPY